MATGRLRLAGLHREVRAYAEYALSIADYYGVDVEVTSGLRSWENQQRLYDNYRACVRAGRFPSAPDCKYPAAPPGGSSHNYGLSWDSWVRAPLMDWWVAVRRWVGFEVPANDLIHAQVPSWRQYVP
ncbi:MAG: D-alanyl-D-alanine carboxypeptidase family protein [Myxococcota bacterium]